MNGKVMPKRMKAILPMALAGILAGGWASARAESGDGAQAAEAGRPVYRDPFWPVGYQPPVVRVTEEGGVDAEGVTWPALPVRGRSRAPDGTYRVLIRGAGVVGENDVVSIRSGGYWFNWRIVRIDEEGVQSVRMGISQKRFQAKPENKLVLSRPARRKETPP